MDNGEEHKNNNCPENHPEAKQEEITGKKGLTKQTSLHLFYQNGKTDLFSQSSPTKRVYSLRERTLESKKRVEEEPDVFYCDSEESEEFSYKRNKKIKKKGKLNFSKHNSISEVDQEEPSHQDGMPTAYDLIVLNKIPCKLSELQSFVQEINQKITKYKKMFFEEEKNRESSLISNEERNS